MVCLDLQYLINPSGSRFRLTFYGTKVEDLVLLKKTPRRLLVFDRKFLVSKIEPLEKVTVYEVGVGV